MSCPKNKDILEGLTCLALNPELQSILFLDAPPFYIQSICNIFERKMREIGIPVETAFIPADTTEDKLWGFPMFSRVKQNENCICRYSLLEPESSHIIPQLLVIPDLANSGLPVKRALISILDSPAASVERYGYGRQWEPNIYCLAFCQKVDLVCISRHLLDRFSIRINASAFTEPVDLRAGSLLTRLHNPEVVPFDAAVIPEELANRLKTGKQFKPKITENALEEILYYSRYSEGLGHRREIALARMAVSIAMMQRSNTIEATHVQAAATIQGITISNASPGAGENTGIPEADKEISISTGGDSEKFGAPQVKLDLGNPVVQEISAPVKSSELVVGEDTVTSQAGISFVEEEIPYPEDGMEKEPMIANLRDFGTARKGRTKGGGAIIGSTHTTSFEDLALFDTIKAALPYQGYRQRKTGEPLCIKLTDLRCNIRQENPGKMMILLIDMSDSIGDNLEEVIKKELEWAYIERALIGLVLVGTTEGDGSRAQIQMFSSRQLASINSLLRKNDKGHATPLAHGLELSLRQIDKATRHSRNAVQEVRFVVITDARANIPLAVSQGKKYAPCRGGLQAFEDAMTAAGKIRRHPKVKTILFHPEVKCHPELPRRLGLALGAQSKVINWSL